MARILAVDDERAILDALARVLGRDGHEVVKAADPTAVPGMDLSRFDLVLCDVMMPGLDGFELVRQIRPDFDGPIVFLTARVAEEDAVAAYGLGADDYVRKPFGAAELRAGDPLVGRERVGADHGARHLARQDHHRNRIHVRGGNTGDGIGCTRAGSHQHYASLAGGTGIAVCHVGCSLLVTNQDVLDFRLFEQRVVYMKESTARVPVDVLNAFVTQEADDHLSAR